jgi:hypothetical protein
MATLYDWAGGEQAFERLINAFYDRVESRSAFVAYVEWGTRLALGNSQPGAAVAEHAPVPRWGWGEAPPYQP